MQTDGAANASRPAKGRRVTRRQGSRCRRCARGDSGFTFAEVLVVITLISVLGAVSSRSLLSYNKSSQHEGATRETVAVLRNAQVRAVTDGVTIECRFIASTSVLEVWKGSQRINDYTLPQGLKWVLGVSGGIPYGFTHPSDMPGSNARTNCFFYPKGSATAGRIGILRTETGKVRYVEVEGLTARVNYCADPAPASPCPA